MINRLTSTRVRFALLFLFSAVLGVAPWIFGVFSSPLPHDLQKTATILPITRTARVDENAASTLVAALNFTPTPSFTPTATVTPTPTNTPPATATTTAFPTQTEIPTQTLTPTPDIYVITLDKVNAYNCPGSQNKKGAIDAGKRYPILGWDQVTEDAQEWIWILIQDVVGQAQVWIRESEYVLVSQLDYKNFVPRAACRPAP